MTSTIAIVTATEVADIDASLFDGLIHAQDAFGQVTWDVVHPTFAAGFIGRPGDGETRENRIAVFDLDVADGMTVIHVTNWALGHAAEFPEVG